MSDNLRVRSHRDLIVWQKAMDLVVSVYAATENFPKTEVYGLTSQIRRCATSIPANIAEGQGRRLSRRVLAVLRQRQGLPLGTGYAPGDCSATLHVE